MFSRLILTGAVFSIAALAQDPPAPVKDPVVAKDAAQEPPKDAKADPKSYLVEPGTHIPLSLINSVSTKNAVPGDGPFLTRGAASSGWFSTIGRP